MGIMLGLTFALSAVETALSVALPLGVRVGLANIIVMLVLITMGKKQAFAIVVMKSAFILLTKGITAFAMSLCGGVCSFIIIVLLFGKKKNSLILVSVAGALTHNLAQMAMSAVITGSTSTLFYAPVLIIAGIIAGTATGIVIAAVLPAAEKAVGKH